MEKRINKQLEKWAGWKGGDEWMHGVDLAILSVSGCCHGYCVTHSGQMTTGPLRQMWVENVYMTDRQTGRQTDRHLVGARV